MSALLPRHVDCLNAIRASITARGFAPSFDEIKDALGLKSKTSVFRIINGLESRGAIRRIPGRPRAIEIVESGDETDALAFLPTGVRYDVRKFATRNGMAPREALVEICKRYFDKVAE